MIIVTMGAEFCIWLSTITERINYGWIIDHNIEISNLTEDNFIEISNLTGNNFGGVFRTTLFFVVKQGLESYCFI